MTFKGFRYACVILHGDRLVSLYGERLQVVGLLLEDNGQDFKSWENRILYITG
jgi:hypothetical protein